MTFSEPIGQGWAQVADIGLAFVLSSFIGLERELRQKSAGLRTHTIVGVASALIMLVSKYGFTDVLHNGTVVLDPSRVAAQIVSGIGFIGGGLIFVRQDAVRGLTTAAVVWLTAAVGMAAGAGLPVLALLVSAGHFIVVYGYTPLAARLPRSRYASSQLNMTYEAAHGVLGRALAECTKRGFVVTRLTTEVADTRTLEAVDVGDEPRARREGQAHQEGSGAIDLLAPQATVVQLMLQGRGLVTDLAVSLSELEGVLGVSAGDANTTSE